MYLEYFGLLKAPFHITPDPDFLYMSPSHREAFAALFYGVEQRKGFISVTGEVGAGKTTILRAFMKRVDENAVRPVYLFNPALTFQELLILTLRGLGSTPEPGRTNAELLDQLNWLLIDEYRAGHNVVLIVDEAQNMPVETLEQLRMLSNLETASDKLLQIVLVGQPELEDKLNLHELRQLKQRCAVRSVVKPLTKDESDEYITHRLRMAGCPREDVFSPAARRAIVRHAKGSPRTINILCDNAMIAGFGSQQELISAAIVKAVIRDMGATSRVKQTPRWAWAAAIAAGGIVVGALVSQVGLLGGGGLASRGMVPVEASVDPALGVKPVVAKAEAPAPKVEMPAAAPVAPKAEPENKVEAATPVPAVAETTAPAKTGAAPVMAEAPKTEAAKAEAPKAEAAKPETPKPVEAPKAVAEIPAPKPAEPVKVEEPKPAAAPAPVVASVGAALAEKAAAEAKPDSDKRTKVAKNTPVEAPAAEKPVVDGPVKAEAAAKAAEPAPAKAETPKPAVVDGPVQPVAEKPAAEVAPKPKEAPAKAETPRAETAPVEKTPATEPAKADTPKPEPVKAPMEKKAEATHSAAAPPLAASDTLQKRVVVNGDCLSRLAREVYGTGDTAIVNALHRYNPQIVNPDLILPGQTVVFPVAALVGAQTTAASPATPAAAEPAGGASP